MRYNDTSLCISHFCIQFQRAVPKTFDKSMENLAAKIEAKQDAIKEAEKKFKSAKKAYKNGGSQTEKANLEKAKKAIERLMEQLEKLEIQRTDKDENKTIALGTSKLNYLDPRLVFAFPFGMFPFFLYSIFIFNSAANRLISEVVQSRRRPLLGPSPG